MVCPEGGMVCPDSGQSDEGDCDAGMLGLACAERDHNDARGPGAPREGIVKAPACGK